MLTADQVKDIAQRWVEYPILQELAASHEELRADLAAAEQRVGALKERQAEAIKRLDGADYDIGRTLADDFESDRLMDAQGGIREARALLTQPAPKVARKMPDGVHIESGGSHQEAGHDLV
jgi:hypothetical protein